MLNSLATYSRFGLALGVLSLLDLACAPADAPVDSTPKSQSAPTALIGSFEDDYGIQYEISDQKWSQFPTATYTIATWNSASEYLIAQNDSSNVSDQGLWTRIDWMRLEGMPPYEWAFCLSTFDSASPESAAKVDIADRENPKTGCNGHPFSRMKRTTGASVLPVS